MHFNRTNKRCTNIIGETSSYCFIDFAVVSRYFVVLVAMLMEHSTDVMNNDGHIGPLYNKKIIFYVKS